MTPIVDLAAVARARGALTDLVAAHPHLRSPDAQARLAANLLVVMESHMPPRLAADTADTAIVGVRMTPAMLAALDDLVAHQQAEHPDLPITRSTVLRGIVRRALEQAPAPVAQAQAPAPVEPQAPVAQGHQADEDLAQAAAQAPAPVAQAAPKAAPKAHEELDQAAVLRILRAHKLSVRAIERGAKVSRGTAAHFLNGGNVTAPILANLSRFASGLV